MTRRQRLHDATSAVVPTGHTRPDGELSVASLILPPVGAANPKAWGRPLATSHTAVAAPAPVSSVSSHPNEQPAITEALAEVILDELPEEVAEKILAPEPLAPEETRGRATEQAADETAEVEARAETEAEHATVVVLPVAPVHPAPAAPPVTRGGAVGLAHREAVPPVLRTARGDPHSSRGGAGRRDPSRPPAPHPDARDPRAVVDRPEGLLRGPGQADGDGPEVPLTLPPSAQAGMPRGQPATRHTSAWAQPRGALGLSPGGRG